MRSYANIIFISAALSVSQAYGDAVHSWQLRSPSLPVVNISGLTHGDSVYVAVGQYGLVMTSADGLSWTNSNSGLTNNLHGVAYGNGTFVAVGDGGFAATASDDVIWTAHDTGLSGHFSNVRFVNNQFVAVGADGLVATSANGVTWISISRMWRS